MATALQLLRSTEIRVSSGPVMRAEATQEPPVAILPRVAAGDSAAMREVIETYGDLVWSLARRFDPRDAEDAVQDIFLDLWKSAARYEAGLGSEATFVAMITRRRLIDRQRRAGRRPLSDGTGKIPEVEDPQPGPEAAVDVATAARALGKLRIEQRRVIELATCEGLSHSEIASQINMPVGTVKAHVRRGLMAIRTALFGAPKEGEP